MNPGETIWPPASITRVAGSVIDGAMSRDRVAAHGDVGAIPRAAGSVDDAAVADDEIVRRRCRAAFDHHERRDQWPRIRVQWFSRAILRRV